MILEWLKKRLSFTDRRPIRSGTPDYHTPRDVMMEMAYRLRHEAGTECWATFEIAVPKSEHWVQFAREDDGCFLINFDYPRQEAVSMVLTNCGITVPDGWKIDYEIQGKAATISAPDPEANAVVGFTEQLFIKLYAMPPNYIITGCLDG